MSIISITPATQDQEIDGSDKMVVAYFCIDDADKFISKINPEKMTPERAVVFKEIADACKKWDVVVETYAAANQHKAKFVKIPIEDNMALAKAQLKNATGFPSFMAILPRKLIPGSAESKPLFPPADFMGIDINDFELNRVVMMGLMECPEGTPGRDTLSASAREAFKANHQKPHDHHGHDHKQGHDHGKGSHGCGTKKDGGHKCSGACSTKKKPPAAKP